MTTTRFTTAYRSSSLKILAILAAVGILFSISTAETTASPSLLPGWTDCSQSLYIAMEGNGGGGSTVVRVDCNGVLDEYANGFSGTSGLAIDASGDLLISDDSPGLWSVDSSGVVTPIATNVTFENPNGLALDSLGRLLVADSGNSVLRLELAADGSASTIEVLAQGFAIPQGVAELPSGDVVFTDQDGYIYSIAPTDSLPIIAPAIANRFDPNALVQGNQGSIALDGSDNIFISNFGERIVMISTGGVARDVVDISSAATCPVGQAGDTSPGFRGLTFTPDGDLVATGYCLDNVYIFDQTDIANAFNTSTPISTLPIPFIENPLSALDEDINGPFGIAFFAADAEKPSFAGCLLPDGADQIFVDTNHAGPFVGTSSAPFATIQDALSAVTGPSVINVASGTYSENVDILTADTHLRGEGPGTTVIDAASGATNGFRYGAANVSIAGFRFTGADNLSSGFVGGVAVLDVQTPEGVEICNNVFVNNEAGVAVGNSSPLVINNTFVNNEMGTVTAADSLAIIRNNIYESNDTAILTFAPGAPTMDHNLFFSNTADFSGTTGCDASDGCIFGFDPLLTNVSGNDFHLFSGSPAIDAGSNIGAPDVDFDADLRPIDGDGDGSHITDIGADETGDGFGEVTGKKFWDLNDNGEDDNEPGLEGWTIYLDDNDNGVLDAPGEPSVQTDELGFYKFSGLTAGSITVREEVQQGWMQTMPGGLSAMLDGDSEVPPVSTSGAGFANFSFDENTNDLDFEVSFSDLAGSTQGLHIHRGAVGVDGPVIYDLASLAGVPATGFTSPVEGILTVDGADVADLLGGGLYVNLHTSVETGGEIRGQILNNDESYQVSLSQGQIVTGIDFGNNQPEESDNCSCAIGIFEGDDTHDWELEWTGTSLPVGGEVLMKVAATTVNVAETGTILVTITDDTGLKTIEVTHPSTMTDNVDYLSLDITPGVTYTFTVENTGTARHYKLGSRYPELAIGRNEVSYLEGLIQDWGINAAPSENVQFDITTDSSNEGANQASQVVITVFDDSFGSIVYGPATVNLTLDSVSTVSFLNTVVQRDLRVRIVPDGHFRMTKTGGDELFYILACPDQSPGDPPVVIPSVGQWGLIALAGLLAAAYVWRRRQVTEELQDQS